MTDRKKDKRTRTAKRSRSGARTECPICGKKLRGEKGLEGHKEAQHNG